MSSEHLRGEDDQPRPAEPAALRDALAAMRLNYAAGRAAIEATEDPQHAFTLATEFRNRIDELVGSAAELRAQMVERVWESEQLSLAALAKRIGVSKARADQFIQAARAAAKQEEERP